MERSLYSIETGRLIESIRIWFDAYVLEPAAAGQLGVIAGAYIIAKLVAPRPRIGLQRMGERAATHPRLATLCRSASAMTSLAVWLLLLGIAILIAETLSIAYWLIELTASLLTAWIVVQIAGGFIKNAAWSRIVTVAVWGLAALNILDLVEPTTKLLDSMDLTFGSVRISALGIIKGTGVLAFLLWLAILVTDLFERQIKKSSSLTPSIQVLFTKFLKIILIVTAIAAGVNAVGIDLTSFAVFAGALGLGIGFGFQKAVSNLVSGVILLLDRSIKPGDIVTVGSTFGQVHTMGARYTSLLTRDGIEHLVPNEDLITHRVENWSYSDNMVRVPVKFGVHYLSDVKKARELALEAAAESERVLQEPKPICSMTEFGNSSVDFVLRVWINDPQDGVANMRGDVLMRLWDKLHEHNIEIPYPQRDLHLRSSEPLTVKIQNFDSDSGD